jgi:hypothetical protein
MKKISPVQLSYFKKEPEAKKMIWHAQGHTIKIKSETENQIFSVLLRCFQCNTLSLENSEVHLIVKLFIFFFHAVNTYIYLGATQ